MISCQQRHDTNKELSEAGLDTRIISGWSLMWHNAYTEALVTIRTCLAIERKYVKEPAEFRQAVWFVREGYRELATCGVDISHMTRATNRMSQVLCEIQDAIDDNEVLAVRTELHYKFTRVCKI
jgi:hypothetical protein